ncbi:hypothetical protein FH609_003080 [Streptomyces sp. 3MP-14]|uniref:Uncharacterized protein n=1 Tax=Streptomyces mimosae TaxID=2586635 RepID=A0A5N6AG41_9ACTN|nr:MULTISPECIES: DUF6256 family protein [Streptomyces]KAB8166528.1 hypothetical protein FH607_012030 [Streptomyces mimosae]KAB8178957.1 hypothetical protein FH609_003080 [Streptomyces sp. 3MP-14]
MRPPTALVLAMTALGYVLLMATLALGLVRARRERGARQQAEPGGRRGRAALVWRVAETVLGGWAVLVVVLLGYYYGLADLGGNFLVGGLTGSAALLAIALPLFALASWGWERAGGRKRAEDRRRAGARGGRSR